MPALKSNPVLKALTPKQNLFARNVAKGMTYSDAYRNSYDASNSTNQSINEEASRLMARPEINSRVDQLRQEIDRSLVVSVINDRETSLGQLRDIASGAKAVDPVRLRAIELVGKAAGIFDEDRRGQERDDRTAAQIEADLLAAISNMVDAGVDVLGVLEGEVVPEDVPRGTPPDQPPVDRSVDEGEAAGAFPFM
jgi:hypothetical protein